MDLPEFNFVAPRPREISEALNDNYVKAILIHKRKVDLSSRIHKAQRLLNVPKVHV